MVWSVEGMGWHPMIRRMALTGRLVSGGNPEKALAVGEARNGELAWANHGGRRTPVIVTTPPSSYGFVAGGVWFVDEDGGEVGRVLIDEPRDRVKAWLAGSELDESAWSELNDQVKGRGVAFPGLEQDVAGDIKRPVLRLRLETGGGYLPEVIATASVCYGDDRFPLTAAENRRSRRLVDDIGEARVVPRDAALEERGLRELQAIGLEMGTGRDSPIWLPAAASDTRESEEMARRYWLRFRHELGRLLEERGWEVRYAPGIGHEPLVFRAEAWQAEIVEEAKGWFHLSAGFEIDGQSFDLQVLLAELLKGGFLEATEEMAEGDEFLFYLPDGEAIVLPVGRFRRLIQRLEGLLEFRWKPGSPMRLHQTELAAVVDEELDIPCPEGSDSLMALVTDVAQERMPDVDVPAGLEATLREYQHEGYQWMQFLMAQGLGGILADDMGLGKTMQTLAHLLMEKESGRSGGKPSLILAPTSVVENWQREAAKFAPSLSVLILQGDDRAARFPLIGKYDLVLSSYALVARDLDELAAHDYHLLVLDEAQHIKNPGAQVSGAVRQLRSSCRVCLSGTPVENHLGELWALMDFLNPELLGKQDVFNSYFRTPIENNGDEGRKQELNQRIGALILRRTKTQVAKELPPKTQMLHKIALSEGQRELYETVRATMDKRVRQAIAARGGGQAQIVFLDALLKLRQVCCHPALMDEEASGSSAKFDHFKEMMRTLFQEGHRVLVFSQFTSMLALIEEWLLEEGVAHLILTGETKNRQELVERFQGGEGAAFLISLKAGGTGLTLTGADTVIHYDPWWNPAAENQATDRAYRIGQDKPVIVHKLICEGTVEEKIQQMQVTKGDLADDVLAGARGSMDADEMVALIGV